MKFWDTSAIISLHVDEPLREVAMTQLEDDGRMAVWWGVPVEFTSAVVRREREGLLTQDEVMDCLACLRVLSRLWHEIQPSPVVRTTAMRLLRTHSLKAADSLQLAAALAASEGDPSTLDFVSFDRRLNLAAIREGFSVPVG